MSAIIGLALRQLPFLVKCVTRLRLSNGKGPAAPFFPSESLQRCKARTRSLSLGQRRSSGFSPSLLVIHPLAPSHTESSPTAESAAAARDYASVPRRANVDCPIIQRDARQSNACCKDKGVGSQTTALLVSERRRGQNIPPLLCNRARAACRPARNN